MSDELKILQPGREVVLNVDGEERKIEIKPFKTGQLLKVIKPVSELAKIYSDTGNLLDLLAEGGDKLVNLVCMLTNLKKEEFESLDLDESVNLVGAILEENKDFFEKKLTPAIQKITKSLTKSEQNTGEASTPA